MRRRVSPALLVVLCLLPAPASGQDNATVREALTAFTELDYGRAAELAEEALTQDLATADRVQAYEVLGYSYGILNRPDDAVSTLSQLIVLAPEREPDPQALPPRLVNLYNQAFGQVLVVRGLLVDSISFVSGADRVTMHYEVSRPSEASLRVVGNGVDAVIEAGLANPGPSRFDWDATVDGRPIPAGEYQFIVSAAEGRNEYQRAAAFRVTHSPVDTMAHVTSLEGFDKLPESETPPRDWRPLGVATLLTGAAAGAAIALNNGAFDGNRLELGIGAVLSLGSGLGLSLRKPDPRPVPAAIQLNQLIDRTIQDRNRSIAEQNAERRRRVRLSIVQVIR